MNMFGGQGGGSGGMNPIQMMQGRQNPMQMMQGGNPLMSMMGGQQGKNHKKAANTLCEMAKQELEHAKELYEMFEEAKAVKAFKEHEEVVKYIGEELHEEIEEWGI